MTADFALHVDAGRGAALLYTSSPSTRVASGWATTINIALDGHIDVETALGRGRGRVVVTAAGVERRSTSSGPVLTLLLDGDDHRSAWQPFRARGPVVLGPTPATWHLADVALALVSRQPSISAEALRRASALVPLGPAALRDERLERLIAVLRGSHELQRPLRAAASSLGITPAHLSERFASVVGLPLKRWVLWERTRRSLGRLAAGSGAAAALDAGFADQAHMVRTFKRHFAYTPGVLRHALAR